MTMQSVRNKRYKLHYQIRQQGYRLLTKKKTIYVKHDRKVSAKVQMLVSNFGYAVQLEI